MVGGGDRQVRKGWELVVCVHVATSIMVLMMHEATMRQLPPQQFTHTDFLQP